MSVARFSSTVLTVATWPTLQPALVLDEVEQVGHLLEVRGHVGVVAGEVDVVELDVNDVLYLLVSRIELAGAGSARCARRHRWAGGKSGGDNARAGGQGQEPAS